MCFTNLSVHCYILYTCVCMAIFMDRLVGIEVGLEISIKFRARYEDIDRGMLLELGGLQLGGVP